tara:strand:- start:51 stop:563 length:513 start_codon:yes stop_codon:yes gene_type:complete
MNSEVPDTRAIVLTVNGVRHEVNVEPRLTLADCLRHVLGLTGTHLGCEHGVCGACTVLVDNQSARSCLMLAVQADGTEVSTVEGLASDDGSWHPLQSAFHEHHALQCGFCTSGILMSMVEFLRENENPDANEVREALSGNICRCTGYQSIVVAVLKAAAHLRASEDGLAQ